MNEQQIGALLACHPYRGGARIHGHPHPAHTPAIRDLQPIERVRGVRDFGDAEVAVQMGHYLRQVERGRHERQEGDIISPDYRQWREILTYSVAVKRYVTT
jgi:hypothetical protein